MAEIRDDYLQWKENCFVYSTINLFGIVFRGGSCAYDKGRFWSLICLEVGSFLGIQQKYSFICVVSELSQRSEKAINWCIVLHERWFIYTGLKAKCLIIKVGIKWLVELSAGTSPRWWVGGRQLKNWVVGSVSLSDFQQSSLNPVSRNGCFGATCYSV